MRRKLWIATLLISLVTVLTTMWIGALQAQTPQPTVEYVAPVETGDPYECSLRYVRGEIDDRVYRNQSTQLITFRSISPTDGRVIDERPASLQEIAHYSFCEESSKLFEQRITSQSEIALPVDGEGNLFPEWLLIQAQNANQQGRVEDVIMFMGLYHYMMADNPELFKAR